MIDYGRGIVGYILTMISLIHASITCVISVGMIGIIIYHQNHHRLKREEKITLLLSGYIYLFICIYLTMLVSTNIQTLLGDVYGTNYDTPWCIFRGYFVPVFCCVIYHTFVVQAVYRLCRIVYSNYRKLQSYRVFVISGPALVVLANILLFPTLVWHDIVYIPVDHYCFTVYTKVRGILWIVLVCYGLPLVYLIAIYIRITLFIHKQSNNLALAIQHRQQRDLLATQRILINVGLLLTVGLPTIAVIFMAFITGVEFPLSQRITWFGVEVSLAILSIQMIFMTPQLKSIVMRIGGNGNRVATIEGSAQIRRVTTGTIH